MNTCRISLYLALVACLAVVIVQAKEQNIRVVLYHHGEISYAPYLLQIRGDDGKFICAGGLISPLHVLTAAECFDNIDFTKAVVVGAATKLNDTGVQRHIEKVTKHPAYNSETKLSNAAVLKLKEPMESNDFKFVHLELTNKPLDNTVYPSTYGWRHFVDLKPEERGMYQLRYDMAPQDVCLDKFHATAENNIFCAVSDGYDEHYCVDDLGSPALYRRKLVGIATSGLNCKSTNYYVSYTNVHSILPFIKEAMQ